MPRRRVWVWQLVFSAVRRQRLTAVRAGHSRHTNGTAVAPSLGAIHGVAMDDDEITPVPRPAHRDDPGDDVARHSSGDSGGSSWSSVSLKNGGAPAAVAAAVTPGIKLPVGDLSVPSSSPDGARVPAAAADEVSAAEAGRPAASSTGAPQAPNMTLPVPADAGDAAVPEKHQSGGRKGNRRRFVAPILVPVNDPNEHFAAAYGKAKPEDETDAEEEPAKARRVDMASASASGLWKFNPVTMAYEMGEGGTTGWRPAGPGAPSSAAPKSFALTPKSMKSWAVAELGDLDEVMAKKSAPKGQAVVLPLHIRVAKAVGFFVGETTPFLAPVTMEQLAASVLLPQWAILLWRLMLGLAITALWTHRVIQPGTSMLSIATALLPVQSTVCLWVSMCGLWMLRHGWSFIAREPLKRMSPIVLCYQVSLTLSVTMVLWHAMMQVLLLEPDWYISTTFARPPPLFTIPTIGLYASAGAHVVDLLLGSVPLHLPYTWMTMALAATYTLSVSVARHGRDLPTPHRLGIGWSGVVVVLLSAVVSVTLFFCHRLLHVTVKGRLETAQLLGRRAELEARIAAAEAEAAVSDMAGGASPAGHAEDRLNRRQQAAALLNAMDTRDKEDIFEEDD